VVIEDVASGVEKLKNGGIADRVVHVRSRLARHDDVSVAEHGQLLRRVGLFNFEFLAVTAPTVYGTMTTSPFRNGMFCFMFLPSTKVL
jgi:hypothetical protein